MFILSQYLFLEQIYLKASTSNFYYQWTRTQMASPSRWWFMTLICEHVASRQKRNNFHNFPLNCFYSPSQDRHIPIHSNNGEPVLDPSQDYVLLSGIENDTHTILRFRRKLKTCDEKYDVSITVSWVFVKLTEAAKGSKTTNSQKPQNLPQLNELTFFFSLAIFPGQAASIICQTLTMNVGFKNWNLCD